MQREPYQDLHPEVECPECGGAGFFGNGPVVEPCYHCRGTGVLINESVFLEPRKPMVRERRCQQRRVMSSPPSPYCTPKGRGTRGGGFPFVSPPASPRLAN